jgi:hypothetical protein
MTLLHRMFNPEARLASRLLAGKLDRTRYQKAMAWLAHTPPRPAVIVDTAIVVIPSGDPRVRLARLGTTMPELSPKDLCAAFLLAQNGADADTLVRTLHLTQHQAEAIVGRASR